MTPREAKKQLQIFIDQREKIRRYRKILSKKLMYTTNKIWKYRKISEGLCGTCGKNPLKRKEDGSGLRYIICSECRDRDLIRKRIERQ